MKTPEVRRLYEYDKWATDQQHRVIATIGEEKYHRDLGSSYGGIHGTLVHIYGAQQIWLSRWTGESPTALPAIAEIKSLGQLMERWQVLRRQMDDFLERLSDEKLEAPHSYKSLAGQPFNEPLWQQMQHLVNHQTYHRGQITTMLRQLEVTPVGIDLIAYYRLVRS